MKKLRIALFSFVLLSGCTETSDQEEPQTVTKFIFVHESFKNWSENDFVLEETLGNYYPTTEYKIEYKDELETFHNYDLIFSSEKIDDSSILIKRDVFALVTHYKNLVNNVSENDFYKFINSESKLKDLTGTELELEFISSSELNLSFQDFSFSNSRFINFEEQKNFIISENGKNSVTVLPMDMIIPEIKVIAINNISPLGELKEGKYFKAQSYTDRDYLLENYKLSKEIWISGEMAEEFFGKLVETNYGFDIFYPNSIINVTMSGVTAMGRVVFDRINRYGPEFAVGDFSEIMNSADIAHTSNEVSFVEGCSQGFSTMSFCSATHFIDVLTMLGIDAVELTGNHNNDWGSEWSEFSMNLYDEKGIVYFGGGRNLAESNEVKYLNVEGLRCQECITCSCTSIDEKSSLVAFIGFNTPGPSYAFATDERAGANPYDQEKALEMLKEANKNADTVIVTVQWQNENYTTPSDSQTSMSEFFLANGADLVVGSQAHGYQGMDFYGGKPAFYGLGNFIFDQMQSDYLKSGFVLQTYFYNGDLLTLNLVPYKIQDYGSPKFVDSSTEKQLLDSMFSL